MNDFKTSGAFNFDIKFPGPVRDSINAHIKANGDKAYMFEKKSGGRYGQGRFGELIKKTMGMLIGTMRKTTENFEISIKGSDRELVGDAMAHSKQTQEQSYLQKKTYEDMKKYLGKRVRVHIRSGPNKNKYIYGTVNENKVNNPKLPRERYPFAVVFDKRYREPIEIVSFPEPDVVLVSELEKQEEQATPPPSSVQEAKPPPPTKKTKPNKRGNNKKKHNRR